MPEKEREENAVFGFAFSYRKMTARVKFVGMECFATSLSQDDLFLFFLFNREREGGREKSGSRADHLNIEFGYTGIEKKKSTGTKIKFISGRCSNCESGTPD